MSSLSQNQSSGTRQRGGAKFRALISLLILAALVYVGVKVIPVYFANYQLQDKMVTEARYATVNRRTDDELKDLIFKEIQERDIPARREDIRVETSQRGVRLSVEYNVTVDLKVYQWQIHFNPSVDSNRVL